MFGLGKDDKGKKQEFLFDLELQIKETGSGRKLKNEIQERISDAKAILRAGQAKEEFDQIGLLLYGYTSMLKVIERAEQKLVGKK